jgi:hypothetical protein
MEKDDVQHLDAKRIGLELVRTPHDGEDAMAA